MRVTQQDIARNLGIDRTTVSVCLSNSPRARLFSEELRKRIEDEARRLNYRPNFFATQLKKGQDRVILVCVASLQDHHAGIILQSFTLRATELGFKVIVSCLEGVADPAAMIEEMLGSLGMTSLALLTRAADALSATFFKKHVKAGCKIVLVGRDCALPQISHVSVDEELCAQLAVQHLTARYDGELWIIGYKKGKKPFIDRRIVYVQARLKALGRAPAQVIKLEPVQQNMTIASVVKALTPKLSRKRNLPSAIIGTTDVLAWGVMRTLNTLGIRIGETVGVMGFDGLFPSDAFFPAMTSIYQPVQELGVQGIELLEEIVSTPDAPARSVTLKPSIHIRESTQRL